MMEEFNSVCCPLTGVHMVEAAAGTGKTYNIQNLVIRLLLEYPLNPGEKQITVDQILVVTYTKEATAELRFRIRKIIRCVLDELNGVESPERTEEAARIVQLLEHAEQAIRELSEIRDDSPEMKEKIRQVMKQRLQDALTDFDSSAISTIHGFCQTVLTENAFRSGVRFSTEIEQDPDSILHELLMNFYRRVFYSTGGAASSFRAGFLYSLRLQPDDFKTPVDYIRSHPDMQIYPENRGNPENLMPQIEHLYHSVMENFQPSLLEWDSSLLYAPGSSSKINIHAKADRKKETGILLHGSISLKLQLLKKYTPDQIMPAVKKSGAARFEQLCKEAFFTENEKLQSLIQQYVQSLKRQAAEEVLKEFEKRKNQENFQTFDDLLQQIRLKSRETEFVSILRKRFKAAILDEFQDTDPVQYETFHNIFFGTSLFLVGDPRQAIYGFRGGDIATYRKAEKDMRQAQGQKYTLFRNFRSSGAMIHAVNDIFCGEDMTGPRLLVPHRYPFADNNITFIPVQSGSGKAGYSVDGIEDPYPLKMTVTGVNAEETQGMCIRQIVKMLHDTRLRLPDREECGIRPGDIAVLVDKNREARAVKQLLAEYNVPAVVRKAVNVFSSGVAEDLEEILRAAVNPGDREQVVRAMNTAVMGYDVKDLIESGGETGRMQSLFLELKTVWEERSFFEMFHLFLEKLNIRSGLLGRKGGERNLTDLLQLRDLLSTECRNKKLTMSGLLNFLSSKRSESGKNKNEEYETILETERDAVTVMTIHGSKGLEFPFVFLPSLAVRAAEPEDGLYHNPATGELIYNLSPDTGHRLLVYAETMQENLRLAYVAVTRAKYYCHIFWPKRQRCHSALDWLFRMRQDTLPSLPPPEDFYAHMADAGNVVIPPEWTVPPVMKEETPDVYNPPVPGQAAKPDCLWKHDAIDSSWKITSFTGLTARDTVWKKTLLPEENEEFIKDIDWETGEDGLLQKQKGIFEIPGSSSTGNAWHEIFEKLDFQTQDRLEDLTGRCLSGSNVLNRYNEEQHERFIQLTVQMVRNVLHTPLPQTGEGFTLSGISFRQRLSELEFHYGFSKTFHKAKLKSVLNEYVYETFGVSGWTLQYEEISGYLKGLIDLVFCYEGKFYIVDWKSNILGGDPENFRPDGIRSEVFRKFYFLQYLIYSVALIKFLRLKIGRFGPEEYEKYYGGAYDLFLRGMNPAEPGSGIWYDRPSFELLSKLEEVIG